MTSLIFVVIMMVFWNLILYSLPLTVSGVLYQRRRKRKGVPAAAINAVPDADWPGVTVLIPAHNEAVVIERSLRRFQQLDYPSDKLRILVIDDASSDDTGRICDRVASESGGQVEVLHRGRPDGGVGKAAALNNALELIDTPYIALYDADSRPRPDAVKKMVAELESSRYVAAVGRLLKLNRRATIFNRFTSFEFSAFQWVAQAGRGQMFDLVLLTGTHFVIRTDAVRHVGGWDPKALTEDLELSLRLYAEDMRATLVPEAISEEQDPEEIRVWLRQRSRWVMGNIYAVIKHLRSGIWKRNHRTFIAVFEMALVFFVFLTALVISDLLLLASLLNLVDFSLHGPYALLWVCALLIFVLTHQLSQAAEGEDGWMTPVVAALMYATYTQLWLLVFVRSVYTYVKQKGEVAWAKTPRLEY